MANLLPNLKFNVFFWKHCIIETQVNLMLINTATKPNLLWFMQIITLLNKSKNSFYLSQHIRNGLMAFAFRRDLLQLYWRISCTMMFGSLMSAQGWLRCKTQLVTCKGTAKRPFFVSTLFLLVMEHALMSCSFSSWFERRIWTKVAPAKIFSIAVGWPSSPKIFTSLNTSWRKIL